MVIFVNGLPLGVIELKNPGDENATLDGAFNQLQTYKKQIPVAVPHQRAAGDLGRHRGPHRLAHRRPRTLHALAHDRRATSSRPRACRELEVLIEGVFDKRRFLDLHPGLHRLRRRRTAG